MMHVLLQHRDGRVQISPSIPLDIVKETMTRFVARVVNAGHRFDVADGVDRAYRRGGVIGRIRGKDGAGLAVVMVDLAKEAEGNVGYGRCETWEPRL